MQCLLDRREGKICNDMDIRCSGGNASSIKPFNFGYFSDISNARIQCLLRTTTKEGIKCDHYFTYDVDPKQQSTLLKILDNRCEPVNYAGITLAIVLTTFLIGCLIILLVKVHNVIQDKREYAKFDEERKNNTTYVNESPLYKPPITTYQMPNSLKTTDLEMSSL